MTNFLAKYFLPIATVAVAATQGVLHVLGVQHSWLDQLTLMLAAVTGASSSTVGPKKPPEPLDPYVRNPPT